MVRSKSALLSTFVLCPAVLAMASIWTTLAPGGLARAEPTEPSTEAVQANEQGIRSLLDREADQAATAFRHALAKAPDSVVVRRNLAAALAAGGERRRLERKPWEAVALFLEAVGLHPERLLYRVQLGRARFQTENNGARLSAHEDFSWVLKRAPDHLDALVSLGEIEYMERRLDEAVRLWSQALALRPHDADVTTRLAKARREQTVERSFRELPGQVFLLRYSPDVSEPLAARALQLCEQAYGELSKNYQSYPDRIVVTLYTPAQFRSATRTQGWVAGLWDGTIRLAVRPRPQDAELRATIRHELTHHLVRAITRHAPVWLHEGLAQINEGKQAETAEARLARGRSPQPRELDAHILSQRDPRRVSRFYDIALAYTAWLNRTRSGAVQDLLRSLAKEESIDSALRATFGESRRALFERWKATLVR